MYRSLVMILVAALSISTSAAQPTGRIEGRVVASPAASFARAGEPNQRRISGRVVVIDRRRAVVAQAVADAKGMFHVDLPPGRYTLHLASASPPGQARDQPVTVAARRVTKIEITYDAGVR